MGFFTSIFEARAGFNDPAKPITGAQLTEFLSVPTATGVSVTPESSLALTAVFACVRVLAETVGSLPFRLYQTEGERTEKAKEHLLYSLLQMLPNPEVTSVEFREMLMGHLALRGNGYAEIVLDGSGRIRELWPLNAAHTHPYRDPSTRKLWYLTTIEGESFKLPFEKIWHIKGLSPDGMRGYSPISLAREAVGLGLAAEQYGARFFGNDSRPGGVLETDKKLDLKSAKRIKASWESAQSGLKNSHRVAVLEQGLHWKQIGLAPEDAQFLETRKFQTNEIARLFRVPPHMIADLDRATFSNIEHQSLSFVIYTLLPWLVKWEQSVYRDLLSIKERLRYRAKFSVAGLLRGDAVTRATALGMMRQNGVLNADEWRAFEEMNPIADGSGQVYLVNGNMVPPGGTQNNS